MRVCAKSRVQYQICRPRRSKAKEPICQKTGVDDRGGVPPGWRVTLRWIDLFSTG